MVKILQIKKGEYLLDVMDNSIKTTYNKDVALDISDWSLDQLGFIIDNLRKVGYTKAKVLTVEEVTEVVKEIGEKISESAKEIGEALNNVKGAVKSDEA